MPEPHLPDLHVHTHFSDDGDDSPQDLISMAANMGMDMIAFTDHDSVAGTPLNSTQGVTILPGVEISSAFCGSEVHLLAYGIDPENSTLKEILETNDRYRWRQFRQRLDSLISLGFRTDADLAVATAAGRPPKTGGILTMLHQLNPTHERLRSYGTPEQPDWNTFYRDFFSPRGIASSSLEAIQPEEIVQLVKEIEAVPVLAHPPCCSTWTRTPWSAWSAPSGMRAWMPWRHTPPGTTPRKRRRSAGWPETST